MPNARARAPRARRTPEEARELILAAAKRLFAERGPDAVGLKEVAAEAGVSHALVSHYFGTYDALVEETIVTHLRAARAALLAKIAGTAEDDVEAWIEHLFAMWSDPLYAKLATWGSLSGRLEGPASFPRRERGLEKVLDVLVGRFEERGEKVDRKRLEVSVMVVICSAVGYAVIGRGLWAALGVDETQAEAKRYREKVAEFARRELSSMTGRRRR